MLIIFFIQLLKLIGKILIYIVALMFMAGLLGSLLDCFLRILILLDFDNLYLKIEDSFGYEFIYLQIFAVLISFLLMPIINKVVDNVNAKFISRKSKIALTLLLILCVTELLTRYFIQNSKSINPEIKDSLITTEWYFWATISLSSLVVATLLQLIDRKINSILLNINSSSLFKSIKRGEKKNFSLFLRPFNIDNKLTYNSEEQVANYFPFSNELINKEFALNLEKELVRLLKDKFPLVGLGKGGINYSGRISTNENNWKRDFKFLSKEANYIFLIPATNSGTFFEMIWIKNNQHILEKTYFILPPKRESIYDEKKWEEIVHKCKTINIYLPAYIKQGCYFQLNDEGVPINKTAISTKTRINSFSLKSVFMLPWESLLFSREHLGKIRTRDE